MGVKNKKILVTGGAGFIGSALIKHFQQFDYEIFVLDNLSFGNREFVNISDDHFFQIDIRDRKKIYDVMAKVKPHILIHLAAVHFIPYCNEHPYESFAINVQGTMNVLDAATKTKPEQFLFASTAAVYPIHNAAVSEEYPTDPLDIYGLSKLTGEYLCKKFHLETGVTTILCRFFNAFGPNETNPHLIPEIHRQVNSGMRKIKLGNVSPKRDFIHTHDMAEGIKTILDTVKEGIDVYNIGSGVEYNVTEIVEAFSKQIGEKIEIEVDPARMRTVERMHLLANIGKLKSLGWEPKIGIDEGIKTL